MGRKRGRRCDTNVGTVRRSSHWLIGAMATWTLSSCFSVANAVVFFKDDFERTSLDKIVGTRSSLVQDLVGAGQSDIYATTRVWTAGPGGLEVKGTGSDGITSFSGKHHLELDTTANSSMSTLVNLVKGQQYRLRFRYRSVVEPGFLGIPTNVGGGFRARVEGPGFSTGNFTVGDTGNWTEANFAFTYNGTTSGEAKLTFEANGTSDGTGSALDDVVLETTDIEQASIEVLKGILPPAVPGLLSADSTRQDIVTPVVVNKTAAIALGKALFWDQGVGSDQMACASCHFHAGADNRVKNQMSPGLLNVGAASSQIFDNLRSGNKSGPNYTVKKGDFPFDPNVDDTLTSSGTFSGQYHTSPAGTNDDVCDRGPNALFHVNGIATRNVEPRNSPTVINAAYNFRNFWDGRANNDFNGVSPFGRRDAAAGVYIAPGPRTTTYQQGLNGYAGTVDTYLDRGTAATTRSTATELLVDDGSPNQKNVLVRFDNLIGTGPGQIPPGSTITSATLRVFVTRTDGLDGVNIHRMLVPWNDSSTWNSLGSGVSLNNVEAQSTSLFRLNAGGSGQQNFTGLASSVQAWVNGAPNHGWVIATNSVDADNWGMSSKEAATATNRPALVVTYTPPATTLSRAPLKLRDSSLASQAVGPVGSDFEMACRSRQFADVGRKLINRKPLALQTIAADDSVLSSLSTLIGSTGTYANLIQKAFAPQYWNGNCGSSCGAPLAGVTPSSAYTQMEANFSMFFGLAVQLYEETLVSDDTRFDRWKRGQTTASASEINGQNVFNGKGNCIECHIGPVGTSAARLQKNENLVEGMLMRDARQAIYDVGFYNLGVVPTAHDNGGGGTDPFGNPLSFTRQYITSTFVDSFGVEPCLFDIDLGLCNDDSVARRAAQNSAVTGTFKTPTLRNVTLTGPYMHNGSLLTLEQVVDFYDRGGNVDNFDKHPEIKPLGFTAQEKTDLVNFLKMLTDDRVVFQRAPFDHPSLRVPNGHVGDSTAVTGGNPLSPALGQDEIKVLPAVGRNGSTVALPTFDAGVPN